MRKIIILNVPSIPTMMLMIIWKHFSTGNAISPTASTQAAKTTTDSKESNSNNDDDDDDKEHNSRNTTTQKAKTRKPTTGRTKNHLIQSTRPFYKSSTRKTTITKLESTPTKQPLTTASTNPQTSFGVLTGG